MRKTSFRPSLDQVQIEIRYMDRLYADVEYWGSVYLDAECMGWHLGRGTSLRGSSSLSVTAIRQAAKRTLLHAPTRTFSIGESAFDERLALSIDQAWLG